MNPYEVWFTLFALFGFVMVAPVWIYFVDAYLSTTPVMQFLATALMPLTALLLVSSWLQPR